MVAMRFVCEAALKALRRRYRNVWCPRGQRCYNWESDIMHR